MHAVGYTIMNLGCGVQLPYYPISNLHHPIMVMKLVGIRCIDNLAHIQKYTIFCSGVSASVVWNGTISKVARTGSAPGTGTRSGRRDRRDRG